MRKRILSGILSLVMLLTLLPVSTLAAEPEEIPMVIEEPETPDLPELGEGSLPVPLDLAPAISRGVPAMVSAARRDGSAVTFTVLSAAINGASDKKDDLAIEIQVDRISYDDGTKFCKTGDATEYFGYGWDGAQFGVEAWDETVDGTAVRNIKLNANATGKRFAIPQNKVVVIDLHGHTITGSATYVLGVNGGSKVTVKDTSEGGGGSIIGNKDTATVINNYGTFQLESGTIHAVANMGISISSAGTATIAAGAVVKTDGTTTSGRAVNVSDGCSLLTEGDIQSKVIGIYTRGNVTVKGGTINGTQYGLYIGTGGSAVITGGTIKAYFYGIYATGESSTVTMCGGTIDASSGNYGVYTYNKTSFHMSGGEINGGSEAGVCIYRGGSHTVSGGTITGQFAVTIWGYQKLNGTELGEAPYGTTILTVSGGRIAGDYHGISGNAREDNSYIRGNTIINIMGGEINGEQGVGIYHPQIGELNISGRTVTGTSGVEMRAGMLRLTDGTITSNTENNELTGIPNGDGPTITGAGVAVSQHVQKRPIQVNISGGTITGYTSFYEDAFQNNTDDDLKKVTLKITGGRFVSTGASSAFSRHKNEFITGGMYSKPVGEYTTSEGNVIDHLGFLTKEELEQFQHTKTDTNGKVHCIKVENSALPYHVGYLTGTGYDIGKLAMGEKSAPLVPKYSLNGVEVKGNNGENGKITYAAEVDVSNVNKITTQSENTPVITGWKSDNEAVATVDTSGVVTAVSAGSATITATLLNGETVPFHVTVVYTYTVTYDLNGGDANEEDYSSQTVNSGAEVTAKAAPTKDGYIFTGWSDGTNTYQPGATLTVNGDITLTAQWRKNSSGGTTYYTLHYESNGGTQYKDERHRRNTVVNLDKVPVREGYQFTGWYGDKDLTEQVTSVKMTGDKTVYAGWHKSTVPDMLNGEDHFAYVIGYGDGTVHPGADISRAEVATIFFRLLKPEIRDGNLTDASPFADVSQGMWCNKAIATMAKLGIVKGRTAETFDPAAPITRAEFAAICARFDTGMTQGSSNFTDLAGHWAKEEVERAVSLGWIMGYADGTFRPDNPITRAEAMTMINRVLCRIPEDGEDLLPGMKTWPDNQPGDWYYLAVQEATNSHEFQHKGEIHEHWTKLTADPDWTRYQD